MTDKELLRRYLDGDAAALDMLIRRHIHMVHTAARRQTGPGSRDAAAADITQAVFIMLMRKAETLSRYDSIAGWLYRATGFCCANLRKTEGRRRAHEQKAASMTPSSTTPSHDEEWRRMLDDALARLPDHDRQVILLHHFEQMPHAQVAEQLGIPEATARKRAQRGIEKLRRILAGKGLTLPVTAIAGLLVTEGVSQAPAAIVTATLASAHGGTLSVTAAALAKALAGTLKLTSAKMAVAVAAGLLVLGTLAVPLIRAANRKDAQVASPPPVPILPAVAPPIMSPPEVIDISNNAAFAGIPYKRVTVDFDNATPAEAAQLFSQATGMDFRLNAGVVTNEGRPEPRLTLHLREVPLVHAVNELARIFHAPAPAMRNTAMAGLSRPNPYFLLARLEDDPTGWTRAIGVINRRPTIRLIRNVIGPWSVAGPFAMRVESIEKIRQPGIPPPPTTAVPMRSGDAWISLAAHAEPDIQPNILRYPLTISIDQFLDDTGQEIRIDKYSNGGNTDPNHTAARFDIPIILPPSHGNSIALLRGTATYMYADAAQRLETTFLTDTLTRPVGQMEVQILPVAPLEASPSTTRAFLKNPGASVFHTLQIRFRRGAMNRQMWEEFPDILRRARVPFAKGAIRPVLLDGDSRPAADVIFESLVQESSDAFLVTYAAMTSDAATNPPHRLQIDLPSEIRYVPVPFEFRNVPLPVAIPEIDDKPSSNAAAIEVRPP